MEVPLGALPLSAAILKINYRSKKVPRIPYLFAPCPLVLQRRAALAAVPRLPGDLPGPERGPGAAAHVARRPLGPGADLAVYH